MGVRVLILEDNPYGLLGFDAEPLPAMRFERTLRGAIETAARIGEWYAPGRDHADPRISPLFGELGGLPPAMLLAGSSELLLDDTLRLSARLEGARTTVWHGMPHVFPAIRGLVDGDRAIAEIADFIHEHTSEATRGA